ncbi:MAG TPA: response regulator transcription factor [Planctomycetota bacterium]
MRKPTLLVIEDDPDIVELLRYNLEREGFRVLVSSDGERGLADAQRHQPDLIVLDLMLPGLDGLEVCRRLRTSDGTRAIPVLMLTAKGEESDIVIGLEMGADDYLTKPFSPRECLARVRALLRRAQRGGGESGRTRVELHGVVLDTTRHEVLSQGEVVPLTRAEFRLLWTLAQRPGRVYSRDELVSEITAGEAFIVDRNVDVHVSAIRKKLGTAGKMIATVRGVGYKCED